AGNGVVAREAFRLDAQEQRKRDGILQTPNQPRGRARQPGAIVASARLVLEGTERPAARRLLQEGSDRQPLGEVTMRKASRPELRTEHSSCVRWLVSRRADRERKRPTLAG